MDRPVTFLCVSSYFKGNDFLRGAKEAGPSSDLYSLGATIFFLVAGRPPYAGKSAAETMTMHLNAPVPELRKAAPGTSDDLSAVVQKLMAKDRAQRYQEPKELIEDLRKIREGSAPQHARQHVARVHASHTVPPQLDATRPIGPLPVMLAGVMPPIL